VKELLKSVNMPILIGSADAAGAWVGAVVAAAGACVGAVVGDAVGGGVAQAANANAPKMNNAVILPSRCPILAIEYPVFIMILLLVRMLTDG
jgi:hypothetical protein